MSGFRKVFVAIMLGALAVFSLPPFHIWPALIPSFVGLSWLIDGCAKTKPGNEVWSGRRAAWRAFLIGWWFGVGFFAVGLYWISFSFLVDSKTFAWLIPIALFSLTGGMAIYIGVACWAVFVFSSRGVPRVFNLALWWVLLEWIRGWSLSGFPWNFVGTTWANTESMIQIASVTGVLGLSLITLLAFVSPALLGEKDLSTSLRWAAVAFPCALLVIVNIGGIVRLFGVAKENVNGVYLRLVQPSIKQEEKWDPNLVNAHLDKLLRLSVKKTEGNSEQPTHVIWPETATPLFLASEHEVVKLVGSVVPKNGALITGSPRRSLDSGIDYKIWNSLHVVSHLGEITSTYDKQHLVPFGEFIPLRGLFNFSSVAGGRKDFTSGEGPNVLAVPGAPPIVPLICFEAIFPFVASRKQLQLQPGWLLNITNDAWFGFSSGPYQHFAASLFRAVEEGLPLVRVANNGLSGIIDSFGRIRIVTSLNDDIAVDGPLPKPLSGATWYSKYGNITVLLLVLFLYIILRSKNFKARD